VAAEIARNYEFDIIHAHDWLTYKAGIAAKKVSGTPLVVHVHATEYDRSGEKNRNDIVYGLERYGMAEADAVCAVSNLTRKIVIEKYGIPAEKVFALHNAVEPTGKEVVREKYVDEKIVTFLGRVTFQKGPEYFVEAAKKVSGKPLVVHVHATEYDRSSEQNRNDIVYGLERYGMAEADAVCAVSNLTRNIVIEKYGIPAEKVFALHNAVDPTGKEVVREKYVDEKIVTFLGRVTFQKGPEYFVEAAKKVLEKVPNVRFVLAGDGDMMAQTISRVAELGIADRFHFTGFLRGSDIDLMFGMSDVYVMPSISEPFGISPLEAMRANVPTIISKQSGVAEVLTHAIKVDFWDIDGMADAIYGIINYPALAGFFAVKGKEDVDNLKWEHVAKKLKEIYEHLA
jgi:glycosyltransferase involved in cell wall biosynthesis